MARGGPAGPLRLGARRRLRRGASVSAAACVLLTTAGCATGSGEVARPESSGSVSTGTAPSTPASPSTSGPPEPSASGPARPPDRGAVRGGGYAATLPGTDAPDRRVDPGPVIPLTGDQADLEEIERLVRAVERIAQQQSAGQPAPAQGSLAEAVGTFSYRYFANGSVAPDPAWVRANIRTGTVPILGRVTCHKVMLPQLRAALQEVVSRGLADEIHPAEYAGCYVPRFIARDPRQGLSLHTWGIAVDLNVPGNQRGTRGEIDRGVVAIFKRWGFAWGGDWSYTDPMHFELARLVESR